MNEFKKTDLLSYSDQIMILIVTLMLLACTYVLLKRFRPFILRNMQSNSKQRIKVIESRQLSKIGHASILQVGEQEFLFVRTRTGVCLSPLEKTVIVQSTRCDA